MGTDSLVQLAVGALGGAIFVAICLRSLPAAVLLYLAFGGVTVIRLGAFKGDEVSQGVFPAHAMASVVIGVWLLKLLVDQRRSGDRFLALPINLPLFLILGVAAISLLLGLVRFDRSVASEMKLTVSIGQIVLFAWGIGSYFVAANVVDDSRWLRLATGVLIAMAGLAWFALLAPFPLGENWEAVSFGGMAASPMCVAMAFHTRRPGMKVLLILLSLAPLYYGISNGKASFYFFYTTAAATVLLMKLRRGLVVGLPVVLALYIIAVPLATQDVLPQIARNLIDREVDQQSLGGRAGRVELARDALSIWTGYPIFGVGPANSYAYMTRYSVIGTPHNQYINVLLELGLVGLVCFLAFLVAGFVTGVRLYYWVRDPFHRAFVLGWLGLFVGMAAGGMAADVTLLSIRNGGLPNFALYYHQWILMGLAMSVVRLERQARVEVTEPTPQTPLRPLWV